MKWYVKVVTDKGGQILPYYGFKTKRDAVQHMEALKKIPGTVAVEVIKR